MSPGAPAAQAPAESKPADSSHAAASGALAGGAAALGTFLKSKQGKRLETQVVRGVFGLLKKSL